MTAVTTTLYLVVPGCSCPYGKALGTDFVGMYGPTQCLGRAGQWICWPQEETEGENKKTKETIKTKVKILAGMSQEDHVNCVWQRLPLPPSPPRKKLQPP
jgi:hypothetical protein